MSKNPTRNYAIQWLQRGQTPEQAAAAAAAVAGASVDATGDVFGDVSGSLLGPLQVVGLGGSPLTLPPVDKRAPVYDETTDTWLNGGLEDIGTAETDTGKRAAPDGVGGVTWVPELASSVPAPVGASLSFPPTQAELVALLGDPATVPGEHYIVTDTNLDLRWSVMSDGVDWFLDTLVRPLAGGGGGATVYGLTTAPEGGWTFQGNPMALTVSGYTYIGYLDASGNAKIAVAHAGTVVGTVTLHAALEVDDHDNPSLVVRPDGKLQAFYSKHVGANIYNRISTNTLASDPTLSGGFGGEASLSAGFGASASTYPSALELSNSDGLGDTLFLFWREHVAGVAYWWYAANRYSGGFLGWSAGVHLHNLTYSKVEPNGAGRVDVATSGHPVDGATKIGHLYRQSSAWHKSDGTTISASMPFAIGDMTTVYTASGSDLVWIADLAINGSGHPVILFFRYPSGSTSDIRVMYAAWSGSAWVVHEVCATGGYIPDTTVGGNPLEVYYPGGCAIDRADPTIVYVSRSVSGQWEMFKYSTADGGATWSNTQLTTGSTSKQIRPVGVRDQDDLAVIWDFGRYDSYVDYSLGMKGLAP